MHKLSDVVLHQLQQTFKAMVVKATFSTQPLLVCFLVSTCLAKLTWNVLNSCQGICQVIISHMIMPKL